MSFNLGRDPYSHLPVRQAINLRLGARLRVIKCIASMVHQADLTLDVFTPTHIQLIKDICSEAEVNARKVFEDETRQAATSTTSTNQRIAEESRQYTGK